MPLHCRFFLPRLILNICSILIQSKLTCFRVFREYAAACIISLSESLVVVLRGSTMHGKGIGSIIIPLTQNTLKSAYFWMLQTLISLCSLSVRCRVGTLPPSDCALCRCTLSDRDVMERLTGISAPIFICRVLAQTSNTDIKSVAAVAVNVSNWYSGIGYHFKCCPYCVNAWFEISAFCYRHSCR